MFSTAAERTRTRLIYVQKLSCVRYALYVRPKTKNRQKLLKPNFFDPDKEII